MIYIIATHASYQANKEIHGPAHTIFNFLLNKKVPLTFIRHPLDPSCTASSIYTDHTEYKINTFWKLPVLNFIKEIYINLVHTIKSNDSVTFIGVDPLNMISGLLGRVLLGNRLSTIYYIVDYAEPRFRNRIINLIYITLDRIAITFSNQIWCVSTRICEKKIQHGVNPKKIMLVPNSPIMQLQHNPPSYNHNLSCILVASLDNYIDFESIIQAIGIVKLTVPKIRLNIIGDGKERKRIMNAVQNAAISDSVVLLGSLDHKSVLEHLSNSFIGIALYSGYANWNVYGDSMKAREYLAHALPVIINDIPSTAQDIAKANAGMVLHTINPEVIASFIIKCVHDLSFYQEMRINAYNLAKRNDKSQILSGLLQLD